MKAYLMYPDRDFDLEGKLPGNEQDLIQDLELNKLLNAMALGDKFLYEVTKKAVLTSVSDMDTLRYRQDILKDCLNHSSIVKEIYNIAVESIASEKKIYWGVFSKYPPAILGRSIQVLQMFVGMLKTLRKIAEESADRFDSEGFRSLFTMFREELNDDYFATVQDHLRELKFRNGVLISAELGKGNKGINYVLRKPNENNQSWMERLFSKKPTEYSITIADRDDNGARALSELKDRGINLVANALAQSTDHILSFFKLLRAELAFYIGCLNLHDQLNQLGEPSSFPTPLASENRRHSFVGLYDVCLALSIQQKVVGNDANMDDKNLVIITGANQGGKSTFLRSIGLAQLMMQCGMFVPADSFSANVCDGIFTHYKREEDATMSSGKLDEEMGRMSEIIYHITENSILLLNESFAATNEREGSEIARQIISALIEKGIQVFYVTHLYEFAQGYYEKRNNNVIFLRAERKPDGERTFKLIEGKPLETSFGEDVYNQIFGNTFVNQPEQTLV